MDSTNIVLTIVLAAFGSSGLFTLIQFFVARNDNKEDKVKNLEGALSSLGDELRTEIARIESKLNQMHGDIDKTEAINARIRILAASDEIRHGQAHSKEFFDQLNEDITLYENYCRDHVDFKNNRSVHAIENINRTYQEALRRNNFL